MLETVLQAARRIPSARSSKGHVDVNVIRRWIQQGKLTKHFAAGQVMVDRREVDLHIELRSRPRAKYEPVNESLHRLLVDRAISEILGRKQ